MRMLPIYFLIDTSESMSWQPITEVKNGLQFIISSLLENWRAIETVKVSVLTFNSVANQLIPLTDLVSFQMKDINATGVASIGGGLNLLSNCIEKEVTKNTLELKGDWEPIVFLMTNTNLLKAEDFQIELNNFKLKKRSELIVFESSNTADDSLLKIINNEIIDLSGLNSDNFKKYINWKNQDGLIEYHFKSNNSFFSHLVLTIILITFLIGITLKIFN